MRQVVLRPESTKYIVDYLQYSTTLLQLALKVRVTGFGTVSTYIPLGLEVTSEQLHMFRYSIHPPAVLNEDTLRYDAAGNRLGHLVPKEKLDDFLVRVIQDHLSAGPERICIFESGMRKSEDIGFGYVGDATVIEHGDEGYFLLTHEDAGKPEHILETVKIARFPWQIAGVLTVATDDVPLTLAKATFSTADLRSLAAATTAIIVGAYDEEGFLVWSD